MQNISHPESAHAVGSIITMARALGLSVVGVGIEQAGQAEILRELNCDFGQGYFFHTPSKAHSTEALLGTLFPRRDAKRPQNLEDNQQKARDFCTSQFRGVQRTIATGS